MSRPTPTRAILGRVLREYRLQAELSQEQLGYRAKLHRNYVGSVERGERNIAFEGIERWLRALEITWGEFGEALDAASGRGRR